MQKQSDTANRKQKKQTTSQIIRIAELVIFIAIISVLTACTPEPVVGGPEKRIYSVSVWDSTRERMLLVEGQQGPTMALVDSWALDPEARKWEPMAGLGEPHPTPAIAWNSDTGTTYAFVSTRWLKKVNYHSLDEVVENVSETWVFDPALDRWNRLETLGTPTSGLLGSRMVYDSKENKMILFGGWVAYGPNAGYKNETWILDPATASWTRLEPVASPAPRNFHAMAYDESAEVAVVFGMEYDLDGTADLQTWIFDLAAGNWNAVDKNPMPESLIYSSMVYVPQMEGCFLFGGMKVSLGLSGPEERERNGTWFFTVEEGWIKLEPKNSPSGRGWHTMAWDPVRERVWLFGGGSVRNRPSRELWYWSLKDKNWHLEERSSTAS